MNIRALILIYCLMAMAVNNACGADRRSDSIDIFHTNLVIDVSDFSAKVLHGEADITFAAKANNIKHIRLDLLMLRVDSIKSKGNFVKYTYNDTVIDITLPAALAIGEKQSINIYYHGTPIQMPGDFGGFYWTDEYAFNIGVSFLAEPHNYGKVWFPCFDNFTSRSSYSFAITTDAKRRALCNGLQDSVLTHADEKKTWYWTMADKIPSYLVSMSASDYEVLTDSYNALKGPLSILLAARADDTASLRKSFIHLKDALAIFEKDFGPYEFNRVGYCLVPFSAGAMEHATNISYMKNLADGTINNENIMAHELSHHWFGDLVTCDSEGEMWLQEGWAKYCELLFYEGLYGEERYKREERNIHENVIHRAHIADSAYWPVSGVPSHLTYSSYTVYDKGADRVHTLRGYMGDSLFFNCMKAYLQEYKWQSVNSDTLRDYLSAVSGLKNINDFFADWIFDGGFPDFSIVHKSVKKVGENYNVSLCIRQRSDHTSHLFHNVPVEVAYFDGAKNKIIRISNVSGDSTLFSVTLPYNPVYIALDYDEKISDAVTDYRALVQGKDKECNFKPAKMMIHLDRSKDSSLVRVEHHYVAPDICMIKNIPGLHLSDYRYWNVDGVWSNDFTASATVDYNGSTNMAGNLDNTLITNSEDSIVLMYRPDAESMWQIDKNVVLHTGKSVQDKIGNITINRLRKGQYTLAIYDVRRQK